MFRILQTNNERQRSFFTAFATVLVASALVLRILMSFNNNSSSRHHNPFSVGDDHANHHPQDGVSIGSHYFLNNNHHHHHHHHLIDDGSVARLVKDACSSLFSPSNSKALRLAYRQAELVHVIAGLELLFHQQQQQQQQHCCCATTAAGLIQVFKNTSCGDVIPSFQDFLVINSSSSSASSSRGKRFSLNNLLNNNNKICNCFSCSGSSSSSGKQKHSHPHSLFQNTARSLSHTASIPLFLRAELSTTFLDAADRKARLDELNSEMRHSEQALSQLLDDFVQPSVMEEARSWAPTFCASADRAILVMRCLTRDASSMSWSRLLSDCLKTGVLSAAQLLHARVFGLQQVLSYSSPGNSNNENASSTAASFFDSTHHHEQDVDRDATCASSMVSAVMTAVMLSQEGRRIFLSTTTATSSISSGGVTKWKLDLVNALLQITTTAKEPTTTGGGEKTSSSGSNNDDLFKLPHYWYAPLKYVQRKLSFLHDRVDAAPAAAPSFNTSFFESSSGDGDDDEDHSWDDLAEFCAAHRTPLDHCNAVHQLILRALALVSLPPLALVLHEQQHHGQLFSTTSTSSAGPTLRCDLASFFSERLSSSTVSALAGSVVSPVHLESTPSEFRDGVDVLVDTSFIPESSLTVIDGSSSSSSSSSQGEQHHPRRSSLRVEYATRSSFPASTSRMVGFFFVSTSSSSLPPPQKRVGLRLSHDEAIVPPLSIEEDNFAEEELIQEIRNIRHQQTAIASSNTTTAALSCPDPSACRCPGFYLKRVVSHEPKQCVPCPEYTNLSLIMSAAGTSNTDTTPTKTIDYFCPGDGSLHRCYARPADGEPFFYAAVSSMSASCRFFCAHRGKIVAVDNNDSSVSSSPSSLREEEEATLNGDAAFGARCVEPPVGHLPSSFDPRGVEPCTASHPVPPTTTTTQQQQQQHDDDDQWEFISSGLRSDRSSCGYMLKRRAEVTLDSDVMERLHCGNTSQSSSSSSTPSAENGTSSWHLSVHVSLERSSSTLSDELQQDQFVEVPLVSLTRNGTTVARLVMLINNSKKLLHASSADGILSASFVYDVDDGDGNRRSRRTVVRTAFADLHFNISYHIVARFETSFDGSVVKLMRTSIEWKPSLSVATGTVVQGSSIRRLSNVSSSRHNFCNRYKKLEWKLVLHENASMASSSTVTLTFHHLRVATGVGLGSSLEMSYPTAVVAKSASVISILSSSSSSSSSNNNNNDTSSASIKNQFSSSSFVMNHFLSTIKSGISESRASCPYGFFPLSFSTPFPVVVVASASSSSSSSSATSTNSITITVQQSMCVRCPVVRGYFGSAFLPVSSSSNSDQQQQCRCAPKYILDPAITTSSTSSSSDCVKGLEPVFEVILSVASEDCSSSSQTLPLARRRFCADRGGFGAPTTTAQQQKNSKNSDDEDGSVTNTLPLWNVFLVPRSAARPGGVDDATWNKMITERFAPAADVHVNVSCQGYDGVVYRVITTAQKPVGPPSSTSSSTLSSNPFKVVYLAYVPVLVRNLSSTSATASSHQQQHRAMTVISCSASAQAFMRESFTDHWRYFPSPVVRSDSALDVFPQASSAIFFSNNNNNRRRNQPFLQSPLNNSVLKLSRVTTTTPTTTGSSSSSGEKVASFILSLQLPSKSSSSFAVHSSLLDGNFLQCGVATSSSSSSSFPSYDQLRAKCNTEAGYISVAASPPLTSTEAVRQDAAIWYLGPTSERHRLHNSRLLLRLGGNSSSSSFIPLNSETVMKMHFTLPPCSSSSRKRSNISKCAFALSLQLGIDPSLCPLLLPLDGAQDDTLAGVTPSDPVRLLVFVSSSFPVGPPSSSPSASSQDLSSSSGATAVWATSPLGQPAAVAVCVVMFVLVMVLLLFSCSRSRAMWSQLLLRNRQRIGVAALGEHMAVRDQPEPWTTVTQTIGTDDDDDAGGGDDEDGTGQPVVVARSRKQNKSAATKKKRVKKGDRSPSPLPVLPGSRDDITFLGRRATPSGDRGFCDDDDDDGSGGDVNDDRRRRPQRAVRNVFASSSSSSSQQSASPPAAANIVPNARRGRNTKRR